MGAPRKPGSTEIASIVIGWSHGGWTIIDALALRAGAEMARATGLSDLPGEPLEGLAAAIMVYPYASVGSYVGRRDWRFAPRALAIVAERDYIVGDSRAALARQRARNPSLEIVVFENATHAFEDAEARDPRVRFNAAATAREHELLRAMIAAFAAKRFSAPRAASALSSAAISISLANVHCPCALSSA